MTNNEYIQAIKMRKSRRTYRSKQLSDEVIDVIKEMVDAVNETADLNFIFVEDATPFFKIFGGKFSMVIIAADDTQKAREDCGYYGESLMLQCVYHGLGTCWVAGTYNENKVCETFKIPDDKRIYAVITIGYVKDKYSVLEKAMYSATHRNNRSYQDMFDACDEKLPDAYAYGMELVELAPSAVNRRPVKFRYENGVLSGYVDEPYSDKSIDFGIAKLHFAIGAKEKGVLGKWSRENIFVENEGQRIKFEQKNTEDNIDYE